MIYYHLNLNLSHPSSALVLANDLDHAAELLADHLKITAGEANRAIIGSVEIPVDKVWAVEGKVKRCIFALDTLKLGFDCADQKA